MNATPTHVPDEDVLIETVLEGNVQDILPHLEQCQSCAQFVQDIQAVKQELESIEDEDPPPLRMEQFSSKRSRHAHVSWLENLATDWYKNPIVLCFGLVVFVICMYILITFVFK